MINFYKACQRNTKHSYTKISLPVLCKHLLCNIKKLTSLHCKKKCFSTESKVFLTKTLALSINIIKQRNGVFINNIFNCLVKVFS